MVARAPAVGAHDDEIGALFPRHLQDTRRRARVLDVEQLEIDGGAWAASLGNHRQRLLGPAMCLGHVGLEAHRIGFADSDEGIRVHHVDRREPGGLAAGQVHGKFYGVLGRGGTIGGEKNALEHEGLQ